jgi:hypothetical protein
MKNTSLALLFLFGTMLSSCDDKDPVVPASKIRVSSMSHGQFSYRTLGYDDRNRISQVILGIIDEEKDSIETVYYVTYAGDLIERIATEGDAHAFEYSYVNGKIAESREYADRRLMVLNQFFYDASGHVDVWAIKQAAPGGEMVGVSRRAYSYDATGNAVSMELETYNPITRGHDLISTSKFLNFDDKKNSGSLFLILANPYHVQFKNNARTWRIENTNGTVGETHFTYEYNADGYAIAQLDLAGELEVKYQFERY